MRETLYSIFDTTDIKKKHFYALLSFILASCYDVDLFRRILLVLVFYISKDVLRYLISFLIIASCFIPGIGVYNQIFWDYVKTILLIFHIIIILIPTEKLIKIDHVPLVISFIIIYIVEDIMQFTTSSAYAIISPKPDEIRALTFFGEVIFLYFLFVFLSAFVNKKKAYLIVGNILFVFGTINYFVLRITGEPFAFRHMLFMKTAADVANKVYLNQGTIIYFVFICLVILVFNIVIVKFCRNKTPHFKLIKIETGIVLFITIFRICFGYLYIMMFFPNLFYGEIPYFLSSLCLGVEKHQNISEYISDIPSFSVNEFNFNSDKYRNTEVIVIMSEAFADISRFKNAEFSTDYIPFTKKIMKEHPSGITYSSTWGNETASSEYSFLTGVPTVLSEPGGVIYQLFMNENKHSIVETFNSAGFNTVGIHPYYEDSYNRNNAWESFGFDDAYYIDDFKDSETIRDFISDKSLYEKIIDSCESDDEPTFCFAVSMQNHALYGDDINTEIEENTVNNSSLNEYLTLQNKSDEALKVLIEYYEKSNKDVYILFFGDHQPMIQDIDESFLGKKELSEEEIVAKYEIPYFLWTNTDKSINVPQKTSMNYLPAILLQHININCEWFDYVLKIREIFPILTDNFIYKGNERLFLWDKKELDSYDNTNPDDEFNQLKQYEVYSYLLSS